MSHPRRTDLASEVLFDLRPTTAPSAAGARAQCAAMRGTVTLLLAAITGCGAADDESDAMPFVLRHTSHSVAASTPLLADGDLLAYLADEATTGPGGTDFNGDGDTADSVAIRVNTQTRAVANLGVATETLAWVNGTLFLEVLEAQDGVDWNNDMDMADRVLLVRTAAGPTPTLVATLDPNANPAIAVAANTLFYSSVTSPTAEFETNLVCTRVPVRGGPPSALLPIVSTIDDPNDDGVHVRVARVVGDVVFCLIDENVDGQLNADGDATDTRILAVIDAGETVPTLRGTALASSSDSALAAVAVGNDWLCGFLVSEAAQGANLNDPVDFVASWQPPNCVGRSDNDMFDHCLHWLLMSDLVANARVVNTGLVGDVAGPVYAHSAGFVAVVSNEAAEGNGGCDLNGDSDFVDPIFRWVAASNPTAPVTPITDANRLLAVAVSLPGGSGGAVTVGSNFAIAVDEAADGRDHDGAPGTDRILVAAHTPASTGQSWNFGHGSTTPVVPVAVSWFADDPRSSTRFLAAFTEEGRGADINGDMDQLDSIPTFPVVLTANRLGFPGVGVAVQANNAGISTLGGYAFYRVSEAAHGATDRNGDGDANDMVLQRVRLDGAGGPTFMGSLNTFNGPSIGAGIEGSAFGAYLYQESLLGTGNDLNGDGDALDIVVRYFRF